MKVLLEPKARRVALQSHQEVEMARDDKTL